MRIAICGIHIESSTFTPHRSSADDFIVLRGTELLDRYPFLRDDSDLRSSVDWVPVLHARALPGGPVDASAYANWKREILDALQAAGPLDGVFLDLHGAMVVDGLDDADGDLAQSVREAVGPGVITSAAMDLHGNVSEQLFDACDLLCCYRTAPHVDVWETRERAVRNLMTAIGSTVPIHRALVHVPLLLPGEQTSTRVEPAASLYQRLPEIADGEHILDASIYVGFAWADEPRCKAAVVVTGVDEDAVRSAAMELATQMWQQRHQFEFVGPAMDLDEAVDAAIGSDQRPFFVSDSGDNPGAGGAADTTAALAAFLAQPTVQSGRVSVLVASIVDAATVQAAQQLGVGGSGTFTVGATLDTRAPGPVPMTAQVQFLGDDPDGGPAAVLRCGGLDVIVTSRRSQYGSAQMFDRVQQPLGSHDIVVVKMGYLEPDLFDAQRGWVIALTAGGVDQHLPRLGHTRIDRPMVPFDADAPAPSTIHTRTRPVTASVAG